MSKLKTWSIVAIISLSATVLINISLYNWLPVPEKSKSSTRGRYRYNLPNYKDIPWAKEHFEEFSNAPYKYKSYVGWRRTPFSGKTINISDEGFRINPFGKACEQADTVVWLLGGSTVWGTGSNDETTLSSQMTAMDNTICVKNYGESAYRARQELALLINLLQSEKEKPDYVISYDGVNDGYYSVVSKAVNNTHHYEKRIQGQQAKLEKYRAHFKKQKAGTGWTELSLDALRYVFINGYLRLIETHITPSQAQEDEAPSETKTLEQIFEPCDLTEEQMDLIDKGTSEQIHAYEAMRLLCEAHQIRFIAVLQPNAWVGAPRRDHILEELSARPQCLSTIYGEYYRTLLLKAKGNIDIVDLSSALDGDEFFYIDHCHVSPNGNQILADKLLSLLQGQQ